MINANHFFALVKQPVNYQPDKLGYDLSYSDGVKTMIEQYKAGWLIGFIALNKPNKFKRAMFHEVIIQRVRGNNFTVALLNGNNGYYRITKLVEANLPCDVMTLWLVNSLLMFPSEYALTN